MTQENTAPNASKKPRIVRVVSDDTLEAWEAQRADYLKTHPEEAAKPIKNELVREALGMPEEETPKEKPEETETPENEEDAAEKAVTRDHESEDERDLEEEKEEKEETEAEETEKTEEKEEEETEEEKTEGKEEEEKEADGEESRVEVEKPAEEEKRKPKIRMITEPVIKRETEETIEAKQPKQSKPRLVEKFEEQATRDILPASPQPGTLITLEEASKEVRVEEARRIWLQREEEKKKKLGFFGKIKATLGFR